MNEYSGKIKKVIGLAALFFCCFMAVTRIIVHSRAGAVSAVSGLLETLLWAFFAGVLFVWLFLDRISRNFTNFLFGGKEYLEETPMSLSHVRGFIASGEYEEAALLIQELYARYPDSPDVNALIFEFYCDHCGKRELAREFAGNYLRNVSKNSSENIEILLRYCELCVQAKVDKDDIIDFLLDQSARSIYSEGDKKRIMERVKGLTR
jgi:hypothetical protein